MKTVMLQSLRVRFMMVVLATCTNLLSGAKLQAQSFTTIHDFTECDPVFYTNLDGSGPMCLAASGDTLYGGTLAGGIFGSGVVFAVKADGSDFRVLHDFGGTGEYAVSTLLFSEDTLYGVAGVDGYVFRMKTDGTGFTKLYEGHAANTLWSLVLCSNALYGTRFYPLNGSAFRLKLDDSVLTELITFTNGNENLGCGPMGGLVLSGNTLYGTTVGGGDYRLGNIFAMNTDGTGFTNLYSFTGREDGAHPYGTLTLSSNVLYGSTDHECSDAFPFDGTIFKINTDGSEFKTIHTFHSMASFWNLLLVGNTVYGMTMQNGDANLGSVFSVNTDGTGFTTLYSFTNSPFSDRATTVLVLLDNALYGITTSGGKYGYGSLFRMALPSAPAPQLALTPSSNNLVISWPASSGRVLQSTTNLASPVWSTHLPAPVVVNGQNFVTNPISNGQQFFRLSQ